MLHRAVPSSFVGFLTVLAYASTAHAVPTVDFNVAGFSGVLTDSGIGGAVEGVSLEISSIRGTDTANDGTFGCLGCSLSFKMDNPLSFLSITGDIDTNGDGAGDIPLLMRADFAGRPEVAMDVIIIGPFHFGIVAAIYMADYNLEFTSFFGVSRAAMGGLLLAWGGLADTPGELTGVSFGGLARSLFTRSVLAVPEPAGTILLGLGFFVAAGARRVKKSQE